MAKDMLSYLPYLGWRMWHVSESSPDMITSKPIYLRFARPIHRSALPANEWGASIRLSRTTSCSRARQLWSSPPC
ncbi:hypothetical protein TNCV_1326271 [Trichonephila clavipes]|nr:hypothetical protein TNCV_1326271 [Trichonephila clavipes]